MVSEIEEGQIGAQGGSSGQGGVVAGPSGMHMQSVRGVSRDRWGDIYANMPVKRMIALYDYDPQELSPNVDAEVSWKVQPERVIGFQLSFPSTASGIKFQDRRSHSGLR